MNKTCQDLQAERLEEMLRRLAELWRASHGAEKALGRAADEAHASEAALAQVLDEASQCEERARAAEERRIAAEVQLMEATAEARKVEERRAHLEERIQERREVRHGPCMWQA